MPQADKAKLYYEAGQTPYVMAALTSTDRMIFSGAAAPWSRKSGYAPVIRPDGIITGGIVTPAASGANNQVDVSAGSAYVAGALVSWGTITNLACSRAADDDTHRQTAIVVAAGSPYVTASPGVDHTGFATVRGDPGAPPVITVAQIEIAHVKFATKADAPVTADQIHQVPNVNREESNYPLYEVDHYSGKIHFYQALNGSHTSGAAKNVYASYAVPVFAQVGRSKDFKPPRNSHSVSSEQLYDERTLGSTSRSIQQGSFTAYLEDGVSDGLAQNDGQTLWFKFFPDQYRGAYLMAQGTLGLDMSYPANGNIMAACTISAEDVATKVNA
jgi:hypothetical protein